MDRKETQYWMSEVSRLEDEGSNLQRSTRKRDRNKVTDLFYRAAKIRKVLEDSDRKPILITYMELVDSLKGGKRINLARLRLHAEHWDIDPSRDKDTVTRCLIQEYEERHGEVR